MPVVLTAARGIPHREIVRIPESIRACPASRRYAQRAPEIIGTTTPAAAASGAAIRLVCRPRLRGVLVHFDARNRGQVTISPD